MKEHDNHHAKKKSLVIDKLYNILQLTCMALLGM